MASLKRVARVASAKAQGKTDTCTDGILELSVTVGYLAADVSKDEIGKLERLMQDYCVAGVVALERGDLEQHLHFQMVCRARVKSARAFGVLVRKYMDWYGQKQISPASKVMCKVLTNRLIHTWKGMIGYCLKDCGTTHFMVAMHNISDHEVIDGKTLHSIYGKANLKSRVVLTNKNIGERAYVWFKYKEERQLTATLLSTLTDMINSTMFIPAATWIIPQAGLGMDHRRMESFWRCLIDHVNVTMADVADVFIRKREWVKGRYHDEDINAVPRKNEDEYVYEGSPPSNNLESVSPKVSPSACVQRLPRSLEVPPLAGPSLIRVKKEVVGKVVRPGPKRKLFQETSSVQRGRKSVQWSDSLGEFIPLQDIAPLPTHTYLPTNEAISCDELKLDTMTDSKFWEDISNIRLNGSVPGKVSKVVVAEKMKNRQETLNGADGACGVEEPGQLQNLDKIEVIDLSSNSDGDTKILFAWPKRAAAVVEDRSGGHKDIPMYTRSEDIVKVVLRTDPPCDPRRCKDPPY